MGKRHLQAIHTRLIGLCICRTGAIAFPHAIRLAAQLTEALRKTQYGNSPLDIAYLM
jgi:hypothetical protein